MPPGDVERPASGPTIVAAGRGISVSGGHGAPNGLNRDLTGVALGRANNVCNGADDCRRAVREQVSLGADVIKFAATGGVLSNVPGGLNQQMMSDEMRAVVETARSFGRRVAAHAHGVDGINAALEAGVDSIEHGTFTNDETFRLYKQTGAYYVPTLLAPAAALADGQRGALTQAQMDKARQAAGLPLPVSSPWPAGSFPATGRSVTLQLCDVLQITDGIFTLLFLFQGGTPPPDPGPSEPGRGQTEGGAR